MIVGVLFDFFMRGIQERHRNGRAPWARVVLHPVDWYPLQREIALHRIDLMGVADPMDGDAMLIYSMVINKSAGIEPGWAVFFDADAASVTMRAISCHEHEDCRSNAEMARACWARAQTSDSPSGGEK